MNQVIKALVLYIVIAVPVATPSDGNCQAVSHRQHIAGKVVALPGLVYNTAVGHVWRYVHGTARVSVVLPVREIQLRSAFQK
jgi:hypothetical protein